VTQLRTPNKTHAKYEAKCGLDDIIGLLYPNLVGKAVIDGKSFPCPLCGPENPQQMRLVSGRKNTKPYWKCSAKHQGDKHCDTIDFIREALRMTHAEAVTLWATLAHADQTEWRAIVEAERPNWYLHQGEAKWTDKPLTQDDADKLAEACAKDEQQAYFGPNPLDDALKAYKVAVDAAGKLKGNEAIVLFEKLKESLNGRDDAA